MGQTIEELIHEFESENGIASDGYPYRCDIADKLAKTGDERVVDYFLKIIKEEDNPIGCFQYSHQVSCLAQSSDSLYETIFSRLVEILENGGEKSREKAIGTFEKLLFDKERLEQRAKTKDISYGDWATEVLIGRLNDKNEDVRTIAVESMRYLKNPRIRETLLNLTTNSNTNIRMYAFSSLERSYGNEPEIQEILSEGVYDDTNICTRHTAMDVISKRKDIENCLKYVPRLTELFNESPELERQSLYSTDCQDAAIALANINSKDSLDTFIDYITHGGIFFRYQAVKVLGNIGDKKALPALKYLLEHPSKFNFGDETTMRIAREAIDELESKSGLVLSV